MARTKKEAGEEFLKGVLALVPEDKRETVQEALGVVDVEKLGEPVVAVETKAEETIAKATKDGELVGQYKRNLDKWYEGVLEQIKQGTEATRKLEELEKGGHGNGNGSDPDNPPAPPPGLSKEDIQKMVGDLLAQSQRGAVGYANYVTKLAIGHLQTFGEAIDPDELVKEAEAAGKNVPDYYREKYADRFKELEEKSLKEREEQIRKDEREKVQKEIQSQTGHRAYPLPGMGTESPTLVGLKEGNGKGQASEFGVEAALKDFYEKGQNFSS